MKKVEKISLAMGETYQSLIAQIRSLRDDAYASIKELDALEKQLEPLKHYQPAEKRTRRKKGEPIQPKTE
jgi:hypothetical protein